MINLIAIIVFLSIVLSTLVTALIFVCLNNTGLKRSNKNDKL